MPIPPPTDTDFADAYQAFFDQSLAGLYILQDDRIVFANPRAGEIFGYPPDELLHLTPVDLVIPEDRERVARNIALRLSGEVPTAHYTARGLHKDGHVVHIEVHGSRVRFRDRPAVAGVVLDVSEQHRQQQRIAEAERRFRSVFDGVRDVVFQTDAEGRWRLLNPAWTEMTGFSVAETLGRPFLEFVHPDDRQANLERFAPLIRREKDHCLHVVRYRTADGGFRWVEVHAELSFDEHGAVTGTTGTLRDVSARVAADKELAESRRRLDEITALLTEGVYVVDEQGCIQFMNPAAEAMLGWTQQELLGKNAHLAFHHSRPDGSFYPVEECNVFKAKSTGRISANHEDHFVRRDGTYLPVAISATPIVRDGTLCGAVVAFHDITERVRQQEELRDSEERYRLLFNSSTDAIFVHHLDEDGRPTPFVEVNDVACRRLGYTREELLTLTPADIDDPDSGVTEEAITDRVCRHGSATFEQVHLTKDGRRIPVEINVCLFEHDGRPTALSLVRDITERKRAEARIQHLAHHDALTGLPNRRLLMDRLDRSLALAMRNLRPLAVLMLDLDGFKPVNDTHGHDVGDELLIEVARRLEGTVRRADTIARLGGDEFVILLAELQRADDAELVAAKIIATVNEPVDLAGTRIHVGCSIGVAVFPDCGTDAAGLLKAADAAMYQSKAQGRNRATIGAPQAMVEA